MSVNKEDIQKILSEDFINIVIRIGILIFLVVMCVRIFAPFTQLILWGLILAVSLYPLYLGLLKRLGSRKGLSASVIVVVGLLVIGVPTIMIGTSFADHVSETYTSIENGSFHIQQPSPSVAEWPIVGKRIYKTWQTISTDLPGYINSNQEQITNLSKGLFSAALNTAGGILLFLAALIIAGIMMAYGESGSKSSQSIFNRIAGPTRGNELWKLSVATIRSVANGVIGIAFIQALLLGIGLILADIPAAGVLAVIILFLGIAQLPALIITIPVIVYMWTLGDLSTTSNIIYSIYLVLAGTSDAILKPLLLGRGVDAPMPIILIGAIGGMITSGIIGLFVGAVFLAVGYQIFMSWVHMNDQSDPKGEQHTE
ncbi:MAG: AI-2E family transporter [Pseudomonadota bacterium]